MPRNAAKKANKNTKSLPISVKFLTTKVNNKKKRNLNNKSKHNNNKKTKKKKNLNNSDTNKHNQKLKESQQQQQRGQKRKKALKQPANARIVTEATSTSFAADNNDADDDDCDANSTTAITYLTRPTAATTTTAATERCKFTINSQDLKVLSSSTTSFSSGLKQTTLSSNRSSVNTVDADQTCGVGGGGVKHSPATATSQRGVEKQKPQQQQQQQNTILKYLKNQRNSKNNLGDNNADDVVGLGSAEETSNIDIHNNKGKDKLQVATTTLLSITTATETEKSVAAASSPALPLATTTTATNQRQCGLSTLYPIVIETHISESKSLAGEVKTTTPTTAAATTTKHSISNTNTTGNCSTNSAIVLKTSDTTTALDTTLSKQTAGADDATKQILQNKSPSPQQQPAKRRKRRYFHQPHEVKARLDSLRTRKAPGDTEQQQQKTQQEQQQQQPHKVDKSLEISQKSTALVQDIAKQQQQQPEAGNKHKFLQAPDTEETLRKRVFPILDVATLNRIETLSDNEVKKPASKRKRSQTAALLGFNIPTTFRSRRVTATAQAAVIVAAAAAAAAASAATSGCGIGVGLRTTPSIAGGGGGGGLVVQKRQQQQLAGGGDFLKPLPIEAGITNSKKRPRIMSLYERPYQTANDGRGGSSSLVSNGYMSTSRSSSSGGAGMPMIMSDSNDSQDMTNAYYLTGNSGSGIAGSSSASSAAAAALLGNGGGVGIALNHAPTMGTLCNIGNTCYLNSVVYTLRFAPQFLHNLHHLLSDLNALQQNIARARSKSSSLGRGISAVHIENARSWSSKDLASMEQYAGSNAAPNSIVNAATPSSGPSSSSALSQVTQKSSHQILTEKLHELYQSLYRNEMSESMEPYHADTLLHAIQDVSSIFEGNQQQDAHEFLMCLLNSIRETNQTLIKAIAECPDVILNGYISNPEDTERDIKQSNNSTSSSGGIISNSNHISVTSALSSLTSNSKSSSFFSRKSKRKDETKNSKNSRLQSPLKDNQIAGNITPQSNSLFYLNTNDLNSTAAAGVTSTSPPSAGGGGGGGSVLTGGGSSSLASPSNSTATTAGNGGDELDAAGASSSSNSTAVSLLLKDKQRLESKIRELGLDFFNDDFEGITVSTTKCLSCETITEQKETMIDIAVPVPQAGYESNEYNTDRPSSFIQNSCITSERFRNENKYRCEQCCGYTEAIRSISYEVLPRLLIIQLSRFSGGMEKINSYIPTSFTLQCFCSKCCELSDANKLHIYKLYSVITHVGATMSVGHYIAYTCSLDWANEYINCPKEQRRRASQERAAAAAAAAAAAMNGSGGTTLTTNPMQQAGQTSSTTNANNVGSSNNSSSSSGTTSFMKIMKFGRSKASSSGDMSKHVKHLNGLTSSGGSGSGSGGGSKAITNGIGKLSMNNTNSAGGTSSASSSSASASCASSTTCPSINCCAMRLTAQQQMHYVHANQQNNINDFNEDSSGYTNGVASSGYSSSNYNNNMQQQPPYNSGSSNNSSGYGSTGRAGTKASYASSQQQLHNGSEPIWYMCDDDKIKAMTQREFEELLSPARKITITPYLLFYARYNLQSSSPPKSAGSSSSPGPVTSSPQASWSNESLQSSGHSAHSSGMRM